LFARSVRIEESGMPRTEPFEQYSEEYDEWFEKNADLYQAELEAVRRLIPSPESEGMEVGVGSGKFAGPLGIRIGVEPSARMAQRAGKLGIEVHPGVAEKLPFSDRRFDFVLMVTILCFVDDITESFREAFRVLKSDGCVIVGFVDRESALGIWLEENRDKSKFYEHATFYSAREVVDRLLKTGFEIAAIRQALLPGRNPGMILEGFGRGAFVVIKGEKHDNERRIEKG
jgi:SAM-dependent methyltransferase